jgi:hypothetical protein
MKDIEGMVATTPLCWFRYVDDTFVIWPQGPESLRDLPRHLNSVHQNIQLTMETATSPLPKQIFIWDLTAL